MLRFYTLVWFGLVWFFLNRVEKQNLKPWFDLCASWVWGDKESSRMGMQASSGQRTEFDNRWWSVTLASSSAFTIAWLRSGDPLTILSLRPRPPPMIAGLFARRTLTRCKNHHLHTTDPSVTSSSPPLLVALSLLHRRSSLPSHIQRSTFNAQLRPCYFHGLHWYFGGWIEEPSIVLW